MLTTESCAVRDRRAGMVLIEHHDYDNLNNRNNYYETFTDRSYSFDYGMSVSIGVSRPG
jgi:hypothetical protein